MSMPRAVRHINEVRILDSLYRHGATSRADLARNLGLMRSTVGNIIGNLIEQGLVLDAVLADAAPSGRTGRPGQLVRLNPAHSVFVGADIGVGHMSVAGVDLLGQVVFSQTVPFEPVFGDADAAIKALATLLKAALKKVPAAQRVQGMCVVVPGLVNRDGSVLRAPVLGWSAVALETKLAAALKWQGALTAENDANAFAAAELYNRSPSASADALFVYLDAGVGGGMVSHGTLLRGSRGHAGEIGHMHLGEHGFDPRTAVQGSFESYVSRDAVLARYQHHGGPAGGLDAFITALQAQAPAALRTISEWAWWLGRGLASLSSVLDPGRIVLGGPVAALYAFAASDVQDAVKRHMVSPFTGPAIEVSSLGGDACALGGAMMLHHELLSIDEQIVYGAHGGEEGAGA